MRPLALVLMLAGCATAGSPGPLAARSSATTGCAELRVSDYRAGDPAANLPERWQADGCGRRFACETFLLASGRPADTRCVESDASLDRRLRRASAAQAARVAGCPAVRVKVQGVIAEADARIYLVNACGRPLRCVVSRVRDAHERMQCTDLRRGPPKLP